MDEPTLETRAQGHEAACFFPLEKWPLTAAEMEGGGRARDRIEAEVVAP
jgi:hypothetical protein